MIPSDAPIISEKALANYRAGSEVQKDADHRSPGSANGPGLSGDTKPYDSRKVGSRPLVLEWAGPLR